MSVLTFKRILSAIFIPFFLLSFFSCSGSSGSTYYSPYDHSFGTVIQAEIVVTDYGTIKLDLYPEVAPITVQNFVDLANSGFYDGLIFHRVASGFVIQGGDPTGTGYGLEGQSTIVGEFASNGIVNEISHVRGVISMARKGDNYDSATSQFFIMLSDQERENYLNGNYAAFGCVTEGMEVVDAIASVEIDDDSAKPLTDVVIETVRILNDY
jgi:peptidyl-prolyl cis-trans isomerase B (cyclophilin B)